MREANVKMQKRMSRRMIYGHYRVLIVSEEVARKGMAELFDIFSRWPENRLTSYIVISKGRAIDLMNVQPKLERFSGEAMRELIQMGGFIPVNIKNFGQSLSHIGSDPIIVYMGERAVESKEKSKEIQVLGYAQFKRDKMVDILEQDEAAGVTWLKREAKPSFLSFNSTHPSNLAFNVSNARTKIKAALDGDQVKVEIDIHARLAIVENLAMENISDDTVLQKVKLNAEQSIKQQINKVIARIKKNGADSLDLGMLVSRGYPRQWDASLKHKWPETLKKADFQIKVDTEIVQSGLASENIVR